MEFPYWSVKALEISATHTHICISETKVNTQLTPGFAFYLTNLASVILKLY